MIFLKNKKGLTLIEVLIVMVLITIVLGLGYNLFFFTTNTFRKSEHEWIRQNEVIAVSNAIRDLLSESLYVEIADSTDNLQTYDGAFYSENNTIYFKNGNNDPISVSNDLNISFSKVPYHIEDDEYFYYNNLISFEVSADDIGYTLDTKVNLENMQGIRSLVGLDEGSVIIFRTAELIQSIPISEMNSFCFIATASFGSSTDPSVMLLRRFRDEFLLNSKTGRKAVDTYYRLSPPIADGIRHSEFLKFIVRMFLYPVTGLVIIITNPAILLAVVMGIVLAVLIYKRRNIRYQFP